MDSETVWRALASPHRRKMLDSMREGPKTTGELWKELPGLSRFAVMQHLGVLAEAGLVLPRKEGRQRFNYLNPVPLREVYERWTTTFSSRAAEAALHLKRYAERIEEVKQMESTEFRLVKIELEMRVNAPREKVYRALTEEYPNWWPHRFKEDSTIYFENRVGGTLGEKFSNGGGAIYGTIVYMDAPRVLITSGMGALSRGMVGFNEEKLEEDGEWTVYKRALSMWGSIPPEMERMFTEGSRQIMETALRNYVEKGIKYGEVVQ